MKNQLAKTIGLLCYMSVITLLFDFKWLMLFEPRSFYSVLLGMVILTASQYRKENTKEELTLSLKWNLIFASFLTTLMSLLSLTSSAGSPDISDRQLTEALLPMLYGSIFYLLLSIVFNAPGRKETSGHMDGSVEVEQIFRDLGLTSRECHVGLKLLEGSSNKEIAAQLYISESTVKKHIQNIYQKIGASDRNSFREICMEAAKCKQP